MFVRTFRKGLMQAQKNNSRGLSQKPSLSASVSRRFATIPETRKPSKIDTLLRQAKTQVGISEGADTSDDLYDWAYSPASLEPPVPVEQRMESLTIKDALNRVTVQDMMDQKQNTTKMIDEDMLTLDGIRKMSKKDVGAIIISSNNKPVGIFTERDYIRKIVLRGKSSANVTIGEVGSYDLITVTPSTSLLHCATLMTDNSIRHLPVMSEDGLAVVGMISARDVAKTMVFTTQKCPETMASIPTLTVEDAFNRMGRVSSGQCWVSSDDSVFHALELMDRHHIGGVFVFEGQEMVGIFTERDYLHRLILKERKSKTTTVGQVMTKELTVVQANTKLSECLAVMARNNIRNLPVVPLSGGLHIDDSDYKSTIGIITLLDVIRYLHHTAA